MKLNKKCNCACYTRVAHPLPAEHGHTAHKNSPVILQRAHCIRLSLDAIVFEQACLQQAYEFITRMFCYISKPSRSALPSSPHHYPLLLLHLFRTCTNTDATLDIPIPNESAADAPLRASSLMEGSMSLFISVYALTYTAKKQNQRPKELRTDHVFIQIESLTSPNQTSKNTRQQ